MRPKHKPFPSLSLYREHSPNAEPEYGQVFLIRCGSELFGIHVRHMLEIRNLETYTRLPYAPRYVRGLVNLRGVISPVIDLHKRLSISKERDTPRTLTVVVRANIADRQKTFGLTVDAVSEAIVLKKSQVQAIDDHSRGDTDYPQFVEALAQINDEMMQLLTVAKLFPDNHDVISPLGAHHEATV